MDKKSKHSVQASLKNGLFEDLAERIKLILHLIRDKRINPLLKLIPIASLLYLIVPDLAPGPIDDAILIWLGAYLFVDLCSQDIVDEHLKTIRRTFQSQYNDKMTRNIKTEDISDAEFWEEPK